MSIIEFDYVYHRKRYVPLIPVSIKTREGEWIEIWAYVDSGAFYSIFDDKIAELLNIDLLKGKRMLAVVGDGSFIPFYLHQVMIKLRDDEFMMKIGFSPKLGVGFNILGMDLFDRYKVSFDNRIKKVIFERFADV